MDALTNNGELVFYPNETGEDEQSELEVGGALWRLVRQLNEGSELGTSEF